MLLVNVMRPLSAQRPALRRSSFENIDNRWTRNLTTSQIGFYNQQAFGSPPEAEQADGQIQAFEQPPSIVAFLFQTQCQAVDAPARRPASSGKSSLTKRMQKLCLS